MKYENRIVFFIDILGFRDLINYEVQANHEDCTAVGNILEYIRKFFEQDIKEPVFQSQQISFFSDSVIISFREDEPDQIMIVFETIRLLQINLIIRDVVLRGGAAYGPLYHDHNLMFGPAFNAAYELETNLADVPRIICDKSLLLLNQGGKSKHDFEQDLPYLLHVVNLDKDDLLYIDYFDKLESTLDTQEEHFQYLGKLKELIEKRMQHFASNVKILSKYIWMKDRYNEAVREIVQIAEGEFEKHPKLLAFFKKISLIP